LIYLPKPASSDSLPNQLALPSGLFFNLIIIGLFGLWTAECLHEPL